MPTPEGAVLLAELLLALGWLLGAGSPKHIFFMSSGTRGESSALGTGSLLLSVFYGMQSIFCAAPRL
jgi:hypothetical protein